MISFIVPVYNTENYIERCITSIMKQKYQNLEIIIIDDGSNDNSGNICDSLRAKDSRIQVIHQKNQGVSVARNIGIKSAIGNWLVFVDADDFISDEYASLIKRYAREIDEILFFDYSVNQLIIHKSSINPIRLDHSNCKQLIAQALRCEKKLPIDTALYSPWAKAFNRHFIIKNNLFYTPNMKIGEDLLFNLKAFKCCKNISYIQEIVYAYCINPDSTIHGYIPDIIVTDKLFLDELEVFLKPYSDMKDMFYRVSYSGMLSCFRRQIFHPNNMQSLKYKIEAAKRLTNSEPYKTALKNYKHVKKIMDKKDRFLIYLCIHKQYLLLNFIYSRLVKLLKRV